DVRRVADLPLGLGLLLRPLRAEGREASREAADDHDEEDHALAQRLPLLRRRRGPAPALGAGPLARGLAPRPGRPLRRGLGFGLLGLRLGALSVVVLLVAIVLLSGRSHGAGTLPEPEPSSRPACTPCARTVSDRSPEAPTPALASDS